ncbi:amidohydrolase family protein [Streptomyces sp. NBC_01236]|nr:amidohydrolase family protein [Streptomyces sp. NBC_01236]
MAEDVAQRERHGSVPQLLRTSGLLNGRLLVAHAVHLSDGDIRLLAESGAGVAHCPGSNAKPASGTASLHALRSAIPRATGSCSPWTLEQARSSGGPIRVPSSNADGSR